MRGYWHVLAISVGMSILTIYFDSYWFTVFLFLWLFYLFNRGRLGKKPFLLSLILFLFFVLYIPSKDVKVHQDQSQHLIFLTGKITESISITKTKVDFIVKDKHSSDKLLIIFFPKNNHSNRLNQDYSKLKHGATCTIKGKFQLADQSRNPGQFNYRKHLLRQGITHEVIVDNMDNINCQGSSFLNKIDSMRNKIINYVTENSSNETAAWLNALVLGDDSLLDEEVIELFQRWSLSHILAISGLHIGLVIAFIYFVFVKLNLMTKEKAYWLMICFLPFYALLAGGQPSVLRASTMFVLFIILNKMKFKMSMTDSVSIVFILLILFDKNIIYHVGFQLSFMVTLGLILSKQWLINSNSNIFRLLQISFVSQMMILPLQFSYFSTFNPLSIIVNTFVVPYFSIFVIPLMFLLIFLLPLPVVLSNSIDIFFTNIHHLFISMIEYIDKIAYFPWILGEIPLLIAIIYYVLLFCFMTNIQNDQFIRSFTYSCFMIVLIISLIIRPYLSPVGSVTMLDIGQGDAFVIELPYRKGVFLIDAGSAFSFDDHKPTKKVYNQIIKPYLYSKGISEIDAIFLSHHHIDHVGSTSFLIEEMDVNQVIISNYFGVAENQPVPWGKDTDVRVVKYNDQLVIRGQEFHILAPENNKYDENENSLVIYTELGNKKWLFTGDIYKRSEKELAKSYRNLDVDVLKVGHHGSKTSTGKTFVNQLNPQYALIPVGENNSYGHPAEEVLEILEGEEVRIFRTDQDGAVQYRFKSKSEGTFSTYLP